jgi:gliding motility-associated-like protein
MRNCQKYLEILAGILIIWFLSASLLFSQPFTVTYAQWPFYNLTGPAPSCAADPQGPQTTTAITTIPVVPGLTPTQLSRGAGINCINTACAGGYNSDTWTTAGNDFTDAVANNKYIEFSISAAAACPFTITQVYFALRRSNTGPNTVQMQYSINAAPFANYGGVLTVPAPVAVSVPTCCGGGSTIQCDSTDYTLAPFTLPIPATGTIVFRLYAWGATGSAGTLRIKRLVLSGFTDIPTATAATAVGCDNFTANWNTIPGISQYFLDVATDVGFGSILPGYNNLSVSGGTHVVTGLDPGTNYYYRVRTPCGTNSNIISVGTTPVPAPTISPAVYNICDGQTVTITPTAPTGATFILYNTAGPGGTQIGSSGSSITTPPLSANQNYWVATVASGCTGTTRTPVQINVISSGGITVTPPGPICPGETAVLSTSSTASPIEWYNVATGGTILGTGSSFTTPPLTTTTTFYVGPGGSCGSGARIPVTVNVGSALPAPLIVSRRPVVCVGGTDSLFASGGGSGAIYKWYDTAGPGGTDLGTGAIFVTPVVGAPTTFWCELIENGCTSSTRSSYRTVPVSLPGSPVPVVVAPICAGSRAVVAPAAVAGMSFAWFTDDVVSTAFYSGVSYTTSVLTADTTLWYAAVVGGCTSSSRTSTRITVKPLPVNPVLTNALICQNHRARFSIPAGSAYDTIHWYRDNVAGSAAFFDGLEYTTSVLTADTTLWYAASKDGCLSSVRSSVKVVVNAAPANPNPPVFLQPFCAGSTVTLGVTPVGSETFRWYANETTTTVASSSNSLIVNNIPIGDTVVYVESVGANGCLSPRIAVVIPTLAPPEGPVIPNPSAPACKGSNVTLLIPNPSGTTLLWYLDTTGYAPIANGNSITFGPIVSDTALWVGAVENSCSTLAHRRTRFSIQMLPLPAAPVVRGDSACEGTTLTLALPNSSGLEYYWYSDMRATVPFYKGAAYTTSVVLKDTLFFIETVQRGCTSETRASLPIKMLPASKGGFASGAATVCAGVNGGKVEVIDYRGSVIKWQSSPDSASWIDVPNSNTNSISYSNLLKTAWYRAVVKRGICADSFSLPVKITVLAIPKADFSGLRNRYCTLTSERLVVSPILSPEVSSFEFYLNGVRFQAQNSTPFPTVAGNYTVMMVAKNGELCTDTLRKSFVLFDTPSVSVKSDTTICEGSTLRVNVLTNARGADTRVITDWGDPPAAVRGNNPYEVIYPEAGIKNISILVISDSCESAVVNQRITVKVQPSAQPQLIHPASERPEVVTNVTVLEARANSRGTATLIWDTGDEQPLYYTEELKATYPRYGRYPLTLTVYNEDRSCSNSYNLGLVEAYPDKVLVLPTGFSPNGDNTNDIFNWKAIGVVSSFSIDIFSRWGERVYHEEKVDATGWDGAFEGKPVPEGVYSYVVKIQWQTGETQTLKGMFNLFR